MDSRIRCMVVLVPLGLLPGCAWDNLLGEVDTRPAALEAATSSSISSSSDDLPQRVKPKELKPNTLVALAALREQMADELVQNPGDKQRLLDEARRAYLQALELEPNFLAAHVGLARLWEKVDQHGKALSRYDEALKVAPRESGLWFEVGMCQARRKEWEPALGRLKKALELDPSNRQYLTTFALCLGRAGHYDESLVWLKKVYDIAESHYTLARMLHHVREQELCHHHLQLALQANPNLQPAQALLSKLTAGQPSDHVLPTRNNPGQTR